MLLTRGGRMHRSLPLQGGGKHAQETAYARKRRLCIRLARCFTDREEQRMSLGLPRSFWLLVTEEAEVRRKAGTVYRVTGASSTVDRRQYSEGDRLAAQMP